MEMASKTMILLWALVICVILPPVAARGIVAAQPNSGIVVDQVVAYLLLFGALMVTYLTHPFNFF